MHSRAVGLLTLLAVFSAACGGTSKKPATPSTSTAGTIYRQGTVRLEQTVALDLDTGTFPTRSVKGADIWFQAVNKQQRYLTPMRSQAAAIAVYGQSAPGFSGCGAAILSGTDIPIETLTTGLYLCASTSEGRFAEIRVVEPAGPSGLTAAITISYTTYHR